MESVSIPKKIHYCWFGGNPIPEKEQMCISSWKKFFPDYEIIRWDESNYDVYKNDYIKEAYLKGKYAFVSDFARFDVVNKYGGLYFDTDVEIIRSFDDILVGKGFFGCEEYTDTNCSSENIELAVNPGLGLASEPNNKIIVEILDKYKELHFVDDNDNIITTTVVTIVTGILCKHGFDPHKYDNQTVEGYQIYEPEYFCPFNYETLQMNVTENTYSIHHYTSSWMTKTERKFHDYEMKLRKIAGVNIAYIIVRILSAPYRFCKKIEEKGLVGTINWFFRKMYAKRSK